MEQDTKHTKDFFVKDVKEIDIESGKDENCNFVAGVGKIELKIIDNKNKTDVKNNEKKEEKNVDERIQHIIINMYV